MLWMAHMVLGQGFFFCQYGQKTYGQLEPLNLVSQDMSSFDPLPHDIEQIWAFAFGHDLETVALVTSHLVSGFEHIKGGRLWKVRIPVRHEDT